MAGRADGTEGSTVHELLRLLSLRVINNSVEQFHIFSKRCEDPAELKTAFDAYLGAILAAVRLRVNSQDRVEADVLLIDNDTYALKFFAGTSEHQAFVPSDMVVRTDETDPLGDSHPNQGVAPFAIAAFLRGEPGVALAHDVQASADISYYAECDAPDEPLGWYEAREFERVYRYPADGRTVPYRSLLSTALAMVDRSGPDPSDEAEYLCIGSLNITHTQAAAFNVADCAWASACASLVASAFEDFYSALEVLRSTRDP